MKARSRKHFAIFMVLIMLMSTGFTAFAQSPPIEGNYDLGEEFLEEIGDNPDGLAGPEYIDSPQIIEYDDGELGPSDDVILPMATSFSRMRISSEGEEFNNIEWPKAGALERSKNADLIGDKEWEIELTLKGNDLPRESDIVLVIDTSGSMGDDNKLANAKTAAIAFVNKLLDNRDLTRIALVSFAGGVTVYDSTNPFKGETQKESLINAINALKATGGTHTQAGIKQASALLTGSDAIYKNIVLLSDGEPTYSYRLHNTSLDSGNFSKSGNSYYTRDNLDMSAFNYSGNAGNGTSSTTRIGWTSSRYYNHGNSAVAESRFAKAAGNTVYTIALNAGTKGTNILTVIASPGKAYTSTPGELNNIFGAIAGRMAHAAENAIVTDPMGDMFTIVPNSIEVNNGVTYNWDPVTKTIKWNIGTVPEGTIFTMKYRVTINDDAENGKVYYTNKATYVEYTNANNLSAKRQFDIPRVGTESGDIVIKYYRVNSSGEPVNSEGVPITRTQAVINSEIYLPDEDLKLNQAYTITAENTIEIGGKLYNYNPTNIVEGGNTSPTTITLTAEVPSQELYFPYTPAENKVTVTFDENYPGKAEDVFRIVEIGEALSTNMPTNPSRIDHVFEGWKDSSGNEFMAATIVTKDITVYAQWRFVPNPKIKVVKSGIVGEKAVFEDVYDTITYTYVITNIGNVPISGPFTVVDDKIDNIDTSSLTELELKPGESITITAEYEVTEDDVEQGYVTNLVTVKGFYDDEEVEEAVDTETVFHKDNPDAPDPDPEDPDPEDPDPEDPDPKDPDPKDPDPKDPDPGPGPTPGPSPGPTPGPTPGPGDEEVIIDEEVPLAFPQLNMIDHFAYIQGYPDNTVRPEGQITREEVAAVFYRLLSDDYREFVLTVEHDFSDVSTDRWSLRHIATLAKSGVITGYPDGSFKPGQFITRAELATITSRFDNLSPFEADEFSDIQGHWANSFINSAAAKGWVSGYPNGTFRPNQYITRAEFVTLVNNVLERRVQKENILEDARQFPDLLESKWYYEAMQEAINSHHYERLDDGFEKWTELYYPVLDM